MLCWIHARQPFFSRSSFLTTYTKQQHTHTTSSRETALLGGRRGTTDPGNFEKRDTNNNHHTTPHHHGVYGGARPGTHFWAAPAGIFVLFILLMETKNTDNDDDDGPYQLGFRSVRFDAACGHGSPPLAAST